MCRSALESPRKVVIFEPYPSVVDPNDPQMLAFNPRKKNYDRVMKALDSITSIREMTQAPYLEIKKQMDKQDPLAHPLLQWVISSNRSHIVKLPVNRVSCFFTYTYRNGKRPDWLGEVTPVIFRHPLQEIEVISG